MKKSSGAVFVPLRRVFRIFLLLTGRMTAA